MPFSIQGVKRSPSLLLLVALLFLLLAAPQMDSSPLHQITISVLTALVLLTALHAVSGRAWQRILAVSLALLWLVSRVWDIAASPSQAELGSSLIFIIFCSFTVGVLLWRVVDADRVDFEVICALPSIYLLLAVIWAVSYYMVEVWFPGSFEGSAYGGVSTSLEILYFSLTTITTLGYGDIAPVGPTVRIWATLEAATGVFFMALLVARLITLYRT
jgi:hypothetical protein